MRASSTTRRRWLIGVAALLLVVLAIAAWLAWGGLRARDELVAAGQDLSGAAQAALDGQLS